MWDRIERAVRFVSTVGNLASWAWRVFLWAFGLTVAAVIAWFSTAWQWYWATFSWFGTGIAFLVAYLLLAIGTMLFAVAASYFRRGYQAAPENDLPLTWFYTPSIEGAFGRPVYSLRFPGANSSQREVELQSANITSAINGARITLEVVAVSPAGINEVVPIDRIQLIPPGAQVELVAKFNLPQGLERQEFLDTWGRFFLNVVADGEAYRQLFDERILMGFFPGHLGPRIMQKPALPAPPA